MTGDERAKVLVIEDNPDDFFFLKSLLAQGTEESPDFRVDSAPRLETGLALLDKEDYDVVLLDLILPDSISIDTFLRVHTRRPDVPIVILTGVKDRAMALHAVRQGAQDFLVKGDFDAQDLGRALAYAVERKRLSRRLEAIVRNTLDGIMVLGRNGEVRFVNPAAEAILMRTAAELLGKPFEHRLTPRDSGELKLVSPGGGVRTVEVRVTELEWEGQPALLACLRDITDLLRLEQLKAEISQRRGLDRLKDQFVGFISRKIKSPLTIIRATFETLKDSFEALAHEGRIEGQPGLMRLAEENLARLARLSDNLMELSQLEAGKTVVKRRRVNLGRLVRMSADAARFLNKESGVDWVVSVPDDLPPVSGDPDLLETLLGHLMENALRHARGRITVAAKVCEPAAAPAAQGVATLGRACLQVSVLDDGPGIPPERQAALFSKYGAADAAAAGGEPDGTGLGLALCEEIVRRHDGRIWVKSEPGRGAAFHVALPKDGEWQ